MPCKMIDFEINERKYQMMEWKAFDAFKRQSKVFKNLAPLMIFGAEVNNPGSMSTDPISLLNRLNEEEIVNLAQEYTTDVIWVDKNKNVDPSTHFDDYPEDLYPMLGEIVKIQFSRFFRGKGLSFLKALQQEGAAKILKT